MICLPLDIENEIMKYLNQEDICNYYLVMKKAIPYRVIKILYNEFQKYYVECKCGKSRQYFNFAEGHPNQSRGSDIHICDDCGKTVCDECSEYDSHGEWPHQWSCKDYHCIWK